MTRVEYMQRWQAEQDARRAIISRENALLKIGKELLEAVAEIDPEAEQRIYDIIGEVSTRHPMSIAA